MSSPPPVTEIELAVRSDSMLFSSLGMRILSALVQFFGVSVLAHCLSRRLAFEDLTSLQGWKSMKWARICIILVLLDSWLFLCTSGVLIFGVGLARGTVTCSLAIFLCIAFYGTSKIFIYCFLIEKVHVVWAPTTNAKRIHSPIYILCVVTVALYPAIAILLIIGRNTYLREDGVCIIGIKFFASIPLLSYDLYVNVFLTSLFLWPLLKSGRINPRLRRVATRTLLAAIAALTTSTINVLVLTLRHGKELGWVCLGSCGTDVICNALVLFWVTSQTGSRNVIIGTSCFPNGANEALIDSHRKPRVAPPETLPDASFPATSIKDNLLERQRKEMTREYESRHQSNNSSGSRLPWFMPSVADFFRKNEGRQEEHQLEVTITTTVQVVEEDIGDQERYSDKPATVPQDLESSYRSEHLEHRLREELQR